MGVIQVLQALLNVSGSIADGLTLQEWFRRRRDANFLSLYCNAFEQSFEEQLPHISEWGRVETVVFDRNALEREVRRRALQIETLPAVATKLDSELLEPLTEILRSGTVIVGGDVSEQSARTLVFTAHRRYQKAALMLCPDTTLQTQIIELEEKSDQSLTQLLNALKKLELLVANSEAAPVPRVLLPEFEPWIQTLSLRRLDEPSDSPKNYTLYDLLEENVQRVILLGKSGSGKTYTMQSMAYAFLTQDLQEGFCAWIPLRAYAHSLTSTIKSMIGWDELPNGKVIRALEDHRAVLLFDGLNEVSEGQRDQCAAEIEQMIRSYRGRLFVSYPTSDHTYFAFDCPVYELLPLEEEQIRQIVHVYFTKSGQPEKADMFLDTVTARSEQTSRDFFSLAQTPLNLRFLLELALTGDTHLDSIRDLYRQVIERRLKWTAQRGKTGAIPADVKFECLADLAFQSVVEDRNLRMPKAFVEKILSSRLTQLESAQVLQEVVRNGLLLEVNGHLDWFHSSFRDYLAGHRLFALAEGGSSLKGFPLGEPRGTAATAYAVRLSTLPSVHPTKRPNVFKALLRNRPTFEAVQAAAAEYDLAPVRGDWTNWERAKYECTRLRWGERFLDAYKQIAAMAQREKFSGAAYIPSPHGLKILFNSTADFCFMIFSDTRRTSFGQLQHFDVEVFQKRRHAKPFAGFCFHAHLIPTLDPEIVAYLQVGIWLRLASQDKNEKRLAEWFKDLNIYGALTPPDWTTWCTLDKPPEPESNITIWSRKLILPWREFYVPISCRIDPVETPAQPTFFSNRFGAIRLGTTPASSISLALLLPWSPTALQLDLDTGVFISFPCSSLTRYYSPYFIEFGYQRGSKQPLFAHFRG